MNLLKSYYLLFLITSCAFFYHYDNDAQALELSVSGNGTSSENQISADQQSNTSVTQSNEAQATNNVSNNADTGSNSVSNNSGESATQTGNIKSTSEVKNDLNTSVVQNECCPEQNSSVTVSGNGSNSTNTVNLDQSSNTDVTINQTAQVQNNVRGNSNTGRNESNNNSGSTFLQTGDIKADSKINNTDINKAKVVIGQGIGNVSVNISGNGSYSENSVNLNDNRSFNSFIFNEAFIHNNVSWDANTGDNRLNDNLGDVRLITGDVVITSTINNKLNFSEFLLSCCKEKEVTPPSPGEEQPPAEEEQPSEQQPSSQPGAPAPAAGGAVFEQAGQVLGAAAEAGGILPFTGSWMLFLFTIISAILFSMGLYLRLHPGRDPSK